MDSQSIEGLSKIAQAYYTNESESSQILAHNFFNAMDNDGDGYITLAEFNAFTEEEEGHISASIVELFNWLDKDGNGRLDFMEVMALYYLIVTNEIEFISCDKCKCNCWQTYFKCVECFENSGNTYDLCTDCYGSKNWDHDHDGRRAQFVDNNTLLRRFRNCASSQQREIERMEDIRKVAQAHYANGSERAQTLAHNFFNAMDDNGDGSITFAEYTSFMKEEGYHTMNDAAWFNAFDKDDSGTLDFMEVMALFYTIKSGRPCCSQCLFFIKEAYFVCTECFQSKKERPYYLCTGCYGNKKWAHNHDGRRSLFMDNYVLLESLRISAFSKNQGGNNTSNTSTSTAIVPAKNNNASQALKAFDVAIRLGQFAITASQFTINAASALSSCTIM